MKHAALWTVVATLVYLLALGRVSVADVLVAVVAAVALVATFRRFAVGRARWLPTWRGAWVLLPALGYVFADVARGTWTVALATLGVRQGLEPGVVEVAMGERSRAGALLTAMLVTLSPGSILVSFDWELRLMRFHLMDAGDAERFRRGLAEFYTRFQRWIVP